MAASSGVGCATAPTARSRLSPMVRRAPSKNSSPSASRGQTGQRSPLLTFSRPIPRNRSASSGVPAFKSCAATFQAHPALTHVLYRPKYLLKSEPQNFIHTGHIGRNAERGETRHAKLCVPDSAWHDPAEMAEIRIHIQADAVI